MTNLVDLQREKSLALAVLNDGAGNTFSAAMIAQLAAMLDAIEQDERIKTLVLTGREGCFATSLEPSAMASSPAMTKALLNASAQLALRLYEFPKPLLIACSGHALGMGAVLLLTADWRTGAEGAFRIGLEAVQAGMTIPQFGAELARDRLSPRYFSRAIINAEVFAPSLAVDAGYLDEVVDELSVLDFACAQAERLATSNPRSFAATKRRSRATTVRLIRDHLAADLAGLTSA